MAASTPRNIRAVAFRVLRITQRPLQSTSADTVLFVDRAAELEKLSRAVRHGFNSLVLGDRGVGKTSLLRRFEAQLADGRTDYRFIEAGNATTVRDLIELAHRAMHRDQPESANALRSQSAASVIDHLRDLAPRDGRRVVMLLDSIGSKIVQQLFGHLRDELWNLPHVWIVAGNGPDRSAYLDPPADSFFDAIVDVGELAEDDAVDLLARRARQAGQDDPAAETLLSVSVRLSKEVTPRTPRNLLAAARDILLESTHDALQAPTIPDALQTRAAKLGRAPAMLFSEVVNLGPVSASDNRLLSRLGWTRPRAVQVFKQLEDAGLVVVKQDEPEGPGRPRKLYAASSIHQSQAP